MDKMVVHYGPDEVLVSDGKGQLVGRIQLDLNFDSAVIRFRVTLRTEEMIFRQLNPDAIKFSGLKDLHPQLGLLLKLSELSSREVVLEVGSSRELSFNLLIWFDTFLGGLPEAELVKSLFVNSQKLRTITRKVVEKRSRGG